VTFHHGAAPGDDQALELALAHALVRRASRGEVREVVRCYRPTAPVVVFGRRDTRLPGFAGAVASARAAGFEPLVRATGGRAVAYTDAALVVDHVRHDTDAPGGLDGRFERFGGRFVDVFRRFGVDARIGAVPGEYCPGEHSVNARGAAKLVGTSQRVVRNAWLFSSLVVLGDHDRTAPVLADVYGALGLPFDPASVGSLAGEVPGLDLEAVVRAVLQAYAADAGQPGPVEEETIALARELVEQHRP
jgi:octanoyl-[GcvH]:protein N-octanoyltransferase